MEKPAGDVAVPEEEKKAHPDLLHLDFDYVYSIIRKQIKGKELLAYKESYQLQRALKSLMKDYKSSLVEKGINPLYISSSNSFNFSPNGILSDFSPAIC